MRTTISLMIIFIFISCKSQKLIVENGIYGTFSGSVKFYDFWYKYTLQLNKDNTFVYEMRTQDANSYCEGKWKLSEKKLLLDCKEPSVEEIIGGKMPKTEFVVEIINKDNLKYRIIYDKNMNYKDITLKRQGE